MDDVVEVKTPIIPERTGQITESVAQRKIGSLRDSLDRAKPNIRSLLGIQEGADDAFAIGVFGSCVKGTATDKSDIDGYLFFARNTNTPPNDDLPYDLSHTFDSPAESLFGYPTGHKPPNPEGKEDIEAYDITTLVEEISKNDYLPPKKIEELAILFSPQVVGNVEWLTEIREKVLEAIRQRSGRTYSDPENGRLRALRGIAFGRIDVKGYGQFEDFVADGQTTWRIVQNEYQKLFDEELAKNPFVNHPTDVVIGAIRQELQEV